MSIVTGGSKFYLFSQLRIDNELRRAAGWTWNMQEGQLFELWKRHRDVLPWRWASYYPGLWLDDGSNTSSFRSQFPLRFHKDHHCVSLNHSAERNTQPCSTRAITTQISLISFARVHRSQDRFRTRALEGAVTYRATLLPHC